MTWIFQMKNSLQIPSVLASPNSMGQNYLCVLCIVVLLPSWVQCTRSRKRSNLLFTNVRMPSRIVIWLPQTFGCTTYSKLDLVRIFIGSPMALHIQKSWVQSDFVSMLSFLARWYVWEEDSVGPSTKQGSQDLLVRLVTREELVRGRSSWQLPPYVARYFP